jgi:polyhydroxybutyrate depolymerase
MQPGCVFARGGGRVIASAGAALLLAAAIAGCGGHGAGASAANGGTLKPSSGTSGCGHHEPSGSLQYTLTVSGHRRTVIVHVPAGYTGKSKLALVLNMHGSGSTASAEETFSGMDATADADHFIVAYPQALIPYSSGYNWNIPGEPMVNGKFPPASAPSDVTFLTTLVRDLEGRYCVDPSRVYATGVSGGGRMADQLACDASSVFAAIAPVAGLRYPSPCPASRPVPVIAFHGTGDYIDPYTGHGLGYWTYSVPTAAHYWAAADHCASSPQTTAGRGYRLIRYTSCSGGAEVELYAITGEGHEWPGGPKMPSAITSALGPQSDAVSANALMWAFFQAHPLS